MNVNPILVAVALASAACAAAPFVDGERQAPGAPAAATAPATFATAAALLATGRAFATTGPGEPSRVRKK